MFTGIYECNTNCSCLKTCLNRVAQEPISCSLQVFMTENKGWGIRTLADIPKVAFVCTVVAELYTEKDAEKIGVENGDEYFLQLDFMNTVKESKENYESEPEFMYDTECDSSSSGEEELNEYV